MPETSTIAPGSATPQVSVVVPLYNEVENLEALYDALTWALGTSDRRYELVLVDDGSHDGTPELLRSIAGRDPHVRAVLFARNQGQTAAMAAGFAHARGELVVTMDGDLQNDPADIGRLLAELEKGFDIVCGWRRFRKDRFATRLLPSKVANKIISWVTGVAIHDTGCSLKAYRSWVPRSLELYSDMHRFIAALAAGVGARVSEIPVRHHPRRFGKSKYGLGRIFRVVADLIVIKMLIQFAAHPIRWFGLLALPLFLLTPVLFAIGAIKLADGGIALADSIDSSFSMASAVTAFIALNVILLGFLAELQLKVSGFFRRRIAVTVKEAR
ncbi:MAG: glycosyltransferase family 2 protein [Planctomycetota bacterium]